MVEIIMIIVLLFLLGIVKIEQNASPSTDCSCQYHAQIQETDEFVDGLIAGYFLS